MIDLDRASRVAAVLAAAALAVALHIHVYSLGYHRGTMYAAETLARCMRANERARRTILHLDSIQKQQLPPFYETELP